MIYLKQSGLTTDEFIAFALAEDIGDGDHTSLATLSEGMLGKARIRMKENGILAGLALAQNIFQKVDKELVCEVHSEDGNEVKKGDIVMTIEGNTRSLLKAERLVLNCMQRMSGIATLTGHYVQAVQGTGTKILDTRKTTPNFRQFEKAAVVCGGGYNHRFGLFDMILIKDNHVDACGGIPQALTKAANYLKTSGKNLPVEIETRNIKEVEEVLSTGVANRIMLDNFTPDLLKEAVDRINKRFETEASGGITLVNIKEYAASGVDYISVGALTHSHKSLDISMKLFNESIK
jgi:nicotinate-nucleotide pyrophosphorylase (carboxylating)